MNTRTTPHPVTPITQAQPLRDQRPPEEILPYLHGTGRIVCSYEELAIVNIADDAGCVAVVMTHAEIGRTS